MRHLVYFHGQPGAPAECPGDAFAIDRADWCPGQDHPPAIDALARAILARFPEGELALVGFSLGAFIAIEVAARIAQLAPDRALSLDLVSAAAPLDSGDYLSDMAGGALFRMARDAPRRFAALVLAQRIAVRLAPDRVIGMLFANSQGEDVRLAADPGFRATLRQILRATFGHGSAGYRRDILAYVGWSAADIARLHGPVRLWHGRCDTWTPPAMAEALLRRFPDANLTWFDGLSHYSTLHAAWPTIVAP